MRVSLRKLVYLIKVTVRIGAAPHRSSPHMCTGIATHGTLHMRLSADMARQVPAYASDGGIKVEM